MQKDKLNLMLDDSNETNIKEVKKFDERDLLLPKKNKQQVTVTISEEVVEKIDFLKEKYKIKSFSEALDIILKSSLGVQ